MLFKQSLLWTHFSSFESGNCEASILVCPVKDFGRFLTQLHDQRRASEFDGKFSRSFQGAIFMNFGTENLFFILVSVTACLRK